MFMKDTMVSFIKIEVLSPHSLKSEQRSMCLSYTLCIPKTLITIVARITGIVKR